MLTCFTEEQTLVLGKSWKATNELRETYVQKIFECIDSNDVTEEEPSLRKLCSSHFIRALFVGFSEYFVANIGTTSIATDPVDLEAFKAATIQATTLDDAKKTAASADFDSCMKANYSLPYSFFSFRSENMPDILQKFAKAFNQVFDFGKLPPTPAFLAVECMHAVLFQNDCVASEEVVGDIIKELHDPHDDITLFQCANKESKWFGEICNVATMKSLEKQWIENCTKGSSDDNGCRVNRMRQYREAHSNCMMQRIKSVDNVERFKEFEIGGANLPDEKKAAAMTYFDECLAKDVTLPHLIFPFEPEKIQGPAILQNITSLINRTFSIGNLPPTTEMRMLDCAGAALALNGCDEATPIEILTKEMNNIIQLDKTIEKDN